MQQRGRKGSVGRIAPAMAFIAFVTMACTCGALSGGTAVPECKDKSTQEACSTCCGEQGHSGHVYSSFDDPPCKCL